MDSQLRQRSVRLAFLALVVLVCFLGVYFLSDIFAPLILGFLIAYVLDPFADGLEACRLPRTAAVLTIFIIFTVVGGSVLVVGGVYSARGMEVAVKRATGEERLRDFPETGDPVPGKHYRDDQPKNDRYDAGYLERLKNYVTELKRDKFPAYLSDGIDEWLDQKRAELETADKKQQVKDTLDRIQAWLELRLSYTFREDRERERETKRTTEQSSQRPSQEGPGLFTFLSYVFLLPFYVFFFLLEIDPIIAAVKRHLPAAHRTQIVRIFGKIDLTIAAFFRGRLTVCLIKATVLAVGLFLMDVPFGIPLGFAAGFLGLIPYIGIYIALVPALLLSWFDAGSLGTLIAMLGFVAAMEAIEGFILIPKFLGQEVGLHPLTIIVTLLVFGKLFGLVGVLLSVPLAAITKILAGEFVMPVTRELAGIAEPPKGVAEPDDVAT